MAVMFTVLNGVLVSSLDEHGYLMCDHVCADCAADGRCKAQNDNDEAMAEFLNSDEHHEELKAQRDEWFNADAYPSGPEHCWGCINEGTCSTKDFLICLEHDGCVPVYIEFRTEATADDKPCVDCSTCSKRDEMTGLCIPF